MKFEDLRTFYGAPADQLRDEMNRIRATCSVSERLREEMNRMRSACPVSEQLRDEMNRMREEALRLSEVGFASVQLRNEVLEMNRAREEALWGASMRSSSYLRPHGGLSFLPDYSEDLRALQVTYNVVRVPKETMKKKIGFID